MDPAARQSLQDFLQQSLHDAGDRRPLADDDSLFLSGRLDSLAMTRLVLFLEERFGVDFGAIDFDVEHIDTLQTTLQLVQDPAAQRPSTA